MRILFTRFPLESAKGGAEKQTLSLMQGLQERGHDVMFLGSCPVLLEECSKSDIAHARLNIGPPPVTKFNIVSFLWRRIGMKKKLIQSFDAHQADNVVMLSLSEKILLTPYALQKGINVFWLEHDSVGRWLSKNPWLFVLRTYAKKVITIVVSKLSKEIYVDLGWPKENLRAIANGIEPPSNASLHTRDATLRIGCIARLSHEKGIDVLIEAVKGAENTALTIVGKGEEESALQARIANDADRITIQSYIPNLTEFFGKIDVFVLPSRSNDPFGLVAAEAMMHGVAIIITDQCGIAGYVENEHDAVIVPAGNAKKLQKALEMMMQDEWCERIARSGKEKAVKEFTVNKMIDTYEQLLLTSRSK